MQVFYYSGIGSRETPRPIFEKMTQLARVLASRGWILRSGGAPGADTAFEEGAPEDRRRIYIPWNGFSDRDHGKGGCVVPEKMLPKHILQQARDMASRHHPGWLNLSEPVRKLMTRNVFQVLGDDLQTPSKFVWCWAPQSVFNEEGKLIDVKGGTGLAVRLAATCGVPVYNMAHAPHLQVMESYMQQYALQENTPPSLGAPQTRRM